MARYQSKPVEIEAVPISEVLMHIERPQFCEVPSWVSGAVERQELVAMHAPERLQVVTLEGRMEGSVDDYLIRGTEGELYPCKRTVFEAKYRRLHG